MQTRTVLVLTFLSLWASAASPAEVASRHLQRKTVKLVIDFGDGFQKHYTQLPHRDKMTVLDALRAAAKHPRGIQFQHRGRGATAFVYQLDGLKNNANGRSWLYRVNGELAKRSCGVYALKAGDVVTWTFSDARALDF